MPGRTGLWNLAAFKVFWVSPPAQNNGTLRKDRMRRKGNAKGGAAAPRVQGAGSVEALPSGSYRVRFRVDGRRVAKVVPTLAEAEELRRAMAQERRADARAAIATAARAVETLSTWGATWLKRRASTGAVRWSADDRRRWAKHVEGSPLAAMPLYDIRPRDLRVWIDGMLQKRKADGEPLRHQTIANTFNLVRKALGDAAADERIASNPAAVVKVPKRTEAGSRWDVLSAEEVVAVEGCEAIPEPLRQLFAVAIFTGLRAGELWALQWGDLRLTGDAPAVTVCRSHGNAPKSGKVRTIPLLPAAVRALSRVEAMAREAKTYAPDALVFPAASGGRRGRGEDARWAPESGGKGKPSRWPGYRAIAGITRDVHFHDLRHTTATHLLAGTWTAKPWPLTAVRDMLRHSGVAVTERYAHAMVSHLHALAREAPKAPSVVGHGHGQPPPSEWATAPLNPSALSPRNPFQEGVSHQSHPSGLNRRPAVYETAALPLS